MTTTRAALDAVDRAFLWHAERSRRAGIVPPLEKPSPTAGAAVPHVLAAGELGLQRSAAAAPDWGAPAAAPDLAAPAIRPDTPTPAATAVTAPESLPATAATETLGDRLLRAVPQAWAHLARRVEEARCDGAEVIAVTGANRRTGRTTVVECLERTLVARGWRVECHDRPPLPMEREASERAGGREGRIVLVDAGVWFPPGPLRRAWLQQQSLGCHAVILVRRADQPACDARGKLLESVGLTVLGEVLTMSPPVVGAVSIR